MSDVIEIRSQSYALSPVSDVVLMPVLKMLNVDREGLSDTQVAARIVESLANPSNHGGICYALTQSIKGLPPSIAYYSQVNHPDGSYSPSWFLGLNTRELLPVLMELIDRADKAVSDRPPLTSKPSAEIGACTIGRPAVPAPVAMSAPAAVAESDEEKRLKTIEQLKAQLVELGG